MLNHEEKVVNSVISIPSGGLADRIRNLLVSIKLAEINGKNVVCYWIVDAECNGFFGDYFEPIPNVEFRRNAEVLGFDNTSKPKLTVTGSGIDLIDGETFMEVVNNPYSHLIKPLPRIQTIIDDFAEMHQLCQRIGLHVRRTDWLINAKAHKCDKLLFDQIDSHTDALFFLASDNIHSQSQLMNLLGDRLVIYKPIVESEKLRQTNLEHAIIDVFLLSRCNDIIGTHTQIKKSNGSYQLTSGFTILAHELFRLNATLINATKPE